MRYTITHHGTKACVALANIFVPFARKAIAKEKLGLLTVSKMVMAVFGDIKYIADNYIDIPAELWNVDSEEGQELAAIIKANLGDAADKTLLDELAGNFITFIPAAKAAYDVVMHEPSYETKATAIGQILEAIGYTIDVIKNNNKTITPP